MSESISVPLRSLNLLAKELERRVWEGTIENCAMQIMKSRWSKLANGKESNSLHLQTGRSFLDKFSDKFSSFTIFQTCFIGQLFSMIYLPWARVFTDNETRKIAYTPHSQGSHAEVLRRTRTASSPINPHDFWTFCAAKVWLLLGIGTEDHSNNYVKMETVYLATTVQRNLRRSVP